MTQYVTLNQVAELGPEMPLPLSHHCLVKIDESLAVVTGGFTSDNLMTDGSFYYQISSQTWTLAPSLALPRHSHSCGVLRSLTDGADAVPIVVVASGDTEVDDVSTEFLAFPHSNQQTIDNAWTEGPDIPLKLEGTSMVATSSHDRLILIGGIEKNGQRSSAMLQLNCLLFSNINTIFFKHLCYWTLMEQKLTLSR